jgi:Animal haem peroxidase
MGPDDDISKEPRMGPDDDIFNAHHGSSQLRGLDTTPASSTETGRFGRMFRHLPAAQHTKQQLKALAATMFGEAATADHKLGVDDDEENRLIPAGYTYLGQFIDHDLTFDPVSSLDRQNDPNALTDFRTPRLDLDSVYGRGPAHLPYIYHPDGTFRLGPGGDLPRGPDHHALIIDPRNDENLIVSQLHGVFLKLHNARMKALAGPAGLTPDARFLEAQRWVRWHYQWVVVHDFLPKVAGQDVVDDILRREKFVSGGLTWETVCPRLLFYHFRKKPFMPVEFSGAAYRFGHSMVRPSYHVNQRTLDGEDAHHAARGSFRIPLFDPPREDDLHGFRALPSGLAIEWRFLFKIGNEPHLPQPSYQIDTTISDPLRKLADVHAIDSGPSWLAERNLIRGWRLGLPSGQDVARAMGIAPLTKEMVGSVHPGRDRGTLKEQIEALLRNEEVPAGQHAPEKLRPEDVETLLTSTPLWFYILAEAEVLCGGKQLGPVGARIVAEVLIGLIAGDPTSYLGVQPSWKPNSAGVFNMPDLLRLAGALDGH